MNTPISYTVHITTTGSQTFKLRGRSTASSTWYAGTAQGVDQNTNVIWRKIAGTAPILPKLRSMIDVSDSDWANGQAVVYNTSRAMFVPGSTDSFTYSVPDNATAYAVYLGRWTTTQAGKTIKITVAGHNGYNAAADQIGESILTFVTSNNSTAGALGIFAAGTHTWKDKQVVSNFKVVNVSGSRTTYDIYAEFAAYSGN